ncbi:hypothetical protein [Ferroacidibacillus organovorans]|uniref:Uncharacterized protein n=1 Tax=Ferroacidibacillus organovorans TaxID=1765683 RepID=A0A101XTK9_9BACL|nr:hypothetical protein [Ferroacidibacillus organovorans]KUO97333.1 hypothetical protein ATW55_04635 [Ferroacidibacillus organovorans]
MDESMFQSTQKTEKDPVSTQKVSRGKLSPPSSPIIIVRGTHAVRKRHTTFWLISALVVCVMTIVAIWMTSVSGALSHVQSAVTQNGAILSQQQAHLDVISQTLAEISNSLSRLRAQMSNLFTTIISLLSHHLQ